MNFGELLALAPQIGTYASVRIIDGVRDGIWSRVGLGPGALPVRKPLVIGLARLEHAFLYRAGFSRPARPGGSGFERQPAETVSWWSATRGALFMLITAAFVRGTRRGYLLTAPVERRAVRCRDYSPRRVRDFAPAESRSDRPFHSDGRAGRTSFATVRLTATGSLWAAGIAHLANLVGSRFTRSTVSGLPMPTPGGIGWWITGPSGLWRTLEAQKKRMPPLTPMLGAFVVKIGGAACGVEYLGWNLDWRSKRNG